MIDVSYFQSSTSNTQIFQNSGTWQTWIKPRNAKMVSFFVIGAGAGGGGGFQAASGVISGGAGGGTAGYTKLTVQASILPDILYALPGTGGAGGTGGASPTAGSSATKSFVCLTPNTSSISNIVCTSGNVAATGGGAGSTIASTGGSSETIATAANMIFANLGQFTSAVGIGGGAGAVGNAGTVAYSSFLMTGVGGGGTGTGAGFTSAVAYTMMFPAITAAPVNTRGVDGTIYYRPTFILFGGRGGGGGTTGGNGGNGAPGCSGGGGGAGTTSAGNGGRGGDGFIIITTTF
jgi:hypothetical protein